MNRQQFCYALLPSRDFFPVSEYKWFLLLIGIVSEVAQKRRGAKTKCLGDELFEKSDISNQECRKCSSCMNLGTHLFFLENLCVAHVAFKWECKMGIETKTSNVSEWSLKALTKFKQSHLFALMSALEWIF